MKSILGFAATAACVVMSTTMTVDAQKRPAAGCPSIEGEAECNAFPGCVYFLDTCTDRATEPCWKKGRGERGCSRIPGCTYYDEPAVFKPAYLDETVPKLKCRITNACDYHILPKYCNAQPHCAWVDGTCQIAGTEPNPNWAPRCFRMEAGQFSRTCNAQIPGCRAFSFTEGEDTISYGCRLANFCGFNKGENLQAQCRSNPNCAWQGGKCVSNPTEAPTTSPTLSPTTAAPTTKSPTAKPTAPTKKPTAQPTTKSPTTKKPTASPTAPTKKPTKKTG